MAENRGNIEILDNIPFKLDVAGVMRRLPLHGDKKHLEGIVRELTARVTPVARPKAVYKVSCVGEKYRDMVEIDGVKFTSRVLRVNLQPLDTVFPFVATCGREIDSVALPDTRMISRYCLDSIKTIILMTAVNFLQEHISKKYFLNQLSVMNPGELESWPLTQQKDLFFLLGNVEEMIDVTLTETGTLSPIKSRSGIFFSSELNFANCQLCKNTLCMGRKAAYNPDVVSTYEQLYAELESREKS